MEIALMGILIAGFSSLWWRLGRIEGTVNGALREWESLKRRCPLCSVAPEEEKEGRP